MVLPFPGRSVEIGDFLHARENPDIAILAPDASAGFIHMQQAAVTEPFQEIVIGG